MQDGEEEIRRRVRHDLVEMLRDLAVLRDRGLLNEPEFQRAKVKILAEYRSSTAASEDKK